uniref:Uncharacterized protein n=1 Tax=Onchocerca volvulus TaxID=6282 RepID=A0A8R1XX97_ONCVO
MYWILVFTIELCENITTPLRIKSRTCGEDVIILFQGDVEAEQPDSSSCKCENNEILVAGLSRKGHAVGDIPVVRFKSVKVANISLTALFKSKKRLHS